MTRTNRMNTYSKRTSVWLSQKYLSSQKMAVLKKVTQNHAVAQFTQLGVAEALVY